MAALVERLQAVPPALLVLDAMGSDQRAVVAVLVAAARPVAVVHPRQARALAKAPGPRAQTAALDARVWAQFVEAVRPPPRPLPDAPANARRALLARWRPLVTRRTAEQHRLGRAPARLQTDSQAPSTWLNARLALLDDDLGTTRRAALVGIAPLPRESGTRRGSRMIWGGTCPGAGDPGDECPCGGPRSCRAQRILRAFAGRGEDRQGRPHGLHAQAVEDPERHGATSHPLPTSGDTRCLADDAPLTNKTVAPLHSRFRARLTAGVRA
jgi:hypothetical protein